VRAFEEERTEAVGKAELTEEHRLSRVSSSHLHSANHPQFRNLGGPMKFNRSLLVVICAGASMFCLLLHGQQPVASAQSAVVPRMMNFTGRAADPQGNIITGIAGATFAIYQDQYEGTPLWMETQNVTIDVKGSYTVRLGATKPDGLPLDLFTTGEARWLGVRINGGEEQPRILLLSVPYALKAADAEPLGGSPASAFVLAAPPVVAAAGLNSVAPAANSSSSPSLPSGSSDVTTSGGAVNTLPLFTTANNVQNSIVTQTGTAAINVVGKLNHPATGAATASAGKNSQPETFVASAFNKTANAAIPQTFQLQAEPAGNGSTTPSGTLNLLFASGTGAPAETGLKISSKGLVTFAAGQTFPTVTGNETVTGNLAASELISTVATGTAPLKLNSTTQVPNLNASLLGGMSASAFATVGSNAFVGNQSITGGLSVFSPTNPVGPIARLGSNGATDSDSVQISTNSGAYVAETFVAGCDGCFVPGVQPGDGGLRVAPGQNLVLGDSGLNRMTLDSAGNASQPTNASGFVKAMLFVNALTPPYQILRCFNSTLTGAAATTVPCGINFTEDSAGAGYWDFAFNFEVVNRFLSATLDWGFNIQSATCIGAFASTITVNTVIVTTSNCSESGEGANFTLLIY
jgi:hypothetical protein